MRVAERMDVARITTELGKKHIDQVQKVVPGQPSKDGRYDLTLVQMDSKNASYFAQREADFEKRLTEAQARWKAAMAPYNKVKVVTYHRSWANFADAFGLDVIGYVEPKPGIPPTPQHTLDVIQAIKAQNVKVIIVEPYFDTKTPTPSPRRPEPRCWSCRRRCVAYRRRPTTSSCSTRT